MTMPKQKRGRSKQTYATPWEFIRAVERRFGPIAFDLAAEASTAKAPAYWGPDNGTDSLSMPWAERLPTGNLWLNPPFGDVAPWARKCAMEAPNRRGLLLMLTPASIATDWFADYVFPHAFVLAIRPRIAFEGTVPNPKTGKLDGFPKDLMLSVYGLGINGLGLWKWK